MTIMLKKEKEIKFIDRFLVKFTYYILNKIMKMNTVN